MLGVSKSEQWVTVNCRLHNDCYVLIPRLIVCYINPHSHSKTLCHFVWSEQFHKEFMLQYD